jgi:hypothetical protein
VENFCKERKLILSFLYVRNFKTKRFAFKRTNRNSDNWLPGASCNGLLSWIFRSISRISSESKLGNYLRWGWFHYSWFNYRYINYRFKLVKINRKALEALLHKFFVGARLDVALKDRFGAHVEPKEWFWVTLSAIEETIQTLMDGTIGNYRYDLATARIVKL